MKKIKIFGITLLIIIIIVALIGIITMAIEQEEMVMDKAKCEAYTKEGCFYYMCMRDATRNFKTSNEIAQHNLDVCLKGGEYNK